MKTGIRFGTLLGIVFAFPCAMGSAEEPPTAAEWIADLEYWENEIRRVHIKPFHTIAEAEFNEQLGDVKQRIPELTAGEIALEFARLAALIGDGHTWLSPYRDAYLSRYPIAVYPFADGLYVTLAMEPYAHLRSAKLISIAGMAAADLLSVAQRYVSGDNEWTRLARCPVLLSIPEFLRKEGLVSEVGPATFTFEEEDGTRIQEELPIVSMEAFNDWAEGRPAPDNLPLYRQRSDEAYWLKPLPEHRTVFVKFNSVRNHTDGPHLAGFSRKVMETIDETEAEYLIIDARHNGGGNGDLLKPLIRRIARHETINSPGHLYVLTSRHTFSAALMFTARMERETEVIFVGEPGAGKPNSYSEYNEVKLPNSKLNGSISSIFHQEGEPGDTRDAIPVDYAVPRTGPDFFNDRDPVLDATLDMIARDWNSRSDD